jgi:hypothetical protein
MRHPGTPKSARAPHLSAAPAAHQEAGFVAPYCQNGERLCIAVTLMVCAVMSERSTHMQASATRQSSADDIALQHSRADVLDMRTCSARTASRGRPDFRWCSPSRSRAQMALSVLASISSHTLPTRSSLLLSCSKSHSARPAPRCQTGHFAHAQVQRHSRRLTAGSTTFTARLGARPSWGP